MEIIAEIGGNFETFDDCKAAIIEAWRAKATAVKFQMFSEFELYGTGSTERKFNPAWLPKLSSMAHKYKLRFGCTAFSQEGLETVSPFVDFYKVASAENEMVFDFPRKLPRIFSTGGTTLDEIAMIVDRNKLGKNDCIMYCVSSYPAEEYEYRYENIIYLHNCFPMVSLGLSDHTTGTYTARNFANFGVTWLEKHFRPMSTKETSPDYPHSIPLDDFRNMVDLLNRHEVSYILSDGDMEFKEKHKRRWITIDGEKKFVRPKH